MTEFERCDPLKFLNGLAADPVLGQLSFNQTRLLLLVGLWGEHEASKASAELGYVSLATISKCADRLEQLGLVDRRRDNEDYRVTILQATVTGETVSRRAERICESATYLAANATAG